MSDEIEAPESVLEQARRWLDSKDGSSDLQRKVVESLLVHLQLEDEEGRDLGDRSEKQRTVARQARKQFKETAELVMALMAARAGKQG